MGKLEADGLTKIDINWLMREKMFEKDCVTYRPIIWTRRSSGKTSRVSTRCSFTETEKFLRLIYQVVNRDDDSRTDVDYKIYLTSTPCYFGGCRYWFICPLLHNGTYCGKRVSKLYFDTKYFGCRHCHNLTYESRNQGGLAKALGAVICSLDVEEREAKLKRHYYRGKPTRKFKSYLRLKEKHYFQAIRAEKLLERL